ncbi:MAG: hypothetical protein FJ191_01220 [Gammaproteobacteria bacterium]|nr:hypothetical protein [Gammaproteobacteria bacterium]
MRRAVSNGWLVAGLLLAGAALAGPADEELGCDQIGEQMAAIFGNDEFQTMLEDAEAANEAVNKTSQKAAARQQAEAPGLVARSMAEAAMATNPVTAAAGGLVANSAARAQGHAQMAQAKRDGAAGAGALGKFRNSAERVYEDEGGNLPRLQRLQQLYEDKGCGPPPGMEDGDFDADEDEE